MKPGINIFFTSKIKNIFKKIEFCYINILTYCTLVQLIPVNIKNKGKNYSL